MISTLLKINWLNLRRDYVALGLTFVLPIVFLSIFAAIFGGMSSRASGGSGESATKIIVVDEDQTDVSRRFVDAISKQAALRVFTAPEATREIPAPPPFTRDRARELVRRGRFPAAAVIPPGFSSTFGSFGTKGKPVEIIHDPANPIVLNMLTGLLQAAAMTAAPDILMETGLKQLETAGGFLTPKQRELVEAFKPILRGENTTGASQPGSIDTTRTGDAPGTMFSGLVEVTATDAGKDPDDSNARPRSMVSYYAAGIGVMFLLFSMANGAGGSLLEEEERGTLERLLVSNIGMKSILLGHWLFFALTGMAQVTLMFIWAALAFNLDLWSPNHLAGFIAMTVVTAGAAAAFGIVLATLCKSRAQLGGVSTIVILIMSALGGSMVPRFVMPSFMETTALFTFNGWALDGYLKVFWYENVGDSVLRSLSGLLPQIAVLSGMAVVFLVISRNLARRWESV